MDRIAISTAARPEPQTDTSDLEYYFPSEGPSFKPEPSPNTVRLASRHAVRGMKRANSGRFPVKVNSDSISDIRLMGLSKPPPIPSQAHNRVLSQQNALRRPAVTPLTLANERIRSNSESTMQSSLRTKRMGIITRKTPELSSVDESKTPIRHIHNRGFSHGSVINGKWSKGANGTNTLASPSDQDHRRGIYARRLSSLPEHKPKSHSADSVAEGAKGILYSLFQVHPHISSLIIVVKDGSSRMHELEKAFFSATAHINDLDRELQQLNQYSEDEDSDVWSLLNDDVVKACMTCAADHQDVGEQLLHNVNKIILHGDQRYVRTLLLLVYGGLLEIRNASVTLAGEYARAQLKKSASRESQNSDRSTTPTLEKPNFRGRFRSKTSVQKLAPAVQPPLPINTTGNFRSASISSAVAATPKSEESFTSSTGNPVSTIDDGEEERIFEGIYQKMSRFNEAVIQVLPKNDVYFVNSHTISRRDGATPDVQQIWAKLHQRCQLAFQMAESLKTSLSSIKLKEQGFRPRKEFWELCNAFISAFVDFATLVKEAAGMNLIPGNIKESTRPLVQMAKQAGMAIEASPWRSLASAQNPPTREPIYSRTIVPIRPSLPALNYLSPVTPGPYVTPLPATPSSAALGPAVQATLPSADQIPHHTPINWLERADSFLSMGSRAGTMQSFITNHHGNAPAALSPGGFRNGGREPPS
ncbi:MAG: RAM signaling network component [Trizodia sp. TS-e1964]|nr:MAG: RAM signaling network component [Trizodia sp. TS-e1964]